MSGRGRRGNALIMVTLSLFMLFAILGLAMDLGWSYYRRNVAQAAAESAALATAYAALSGSTVTCGSSVICSSTAVTCPGTNSTNIHTGCQYASTNGFTNAGSQTVTIKANCGTGSTVCSAGSPPTVSGVSSAIYWASATITETNSQIFSSLFGHTLGTVAVQATAGIFNGTVPTCLYVLDAHASNAAVVSGSNSFIQMSCTMYIDSNSSTALNVSGQGSITAPAIDVVGNYASCQLGQTCKFSPNAPQTNQASVADPLSSLPAPTYSGCGTGYNSTTSTWNGSTSQANINQGTQSLNAGVYCGGILITGNAQVTFNAGTYILNGGGLTINSANSTATGTGVTFFNTANGYTYGPVTISGVADGAVNLSAPNAGTYAGVLFYQDRTIVSTSQNSINGNSNPKMVGDLYFPTTPLLLTGGSAQTPFQGLVIADTFTANGGGVFISLSGPATCCAASTFATLIQ